MTLRSLLVAALVLAFAGCQKSDEPTPKTAAELTADGWAAYGTGSFGTAHTHFEEAISADANFADAYNGSGWANARLANLTAAAGRFTTGLQKSAANKEMEAGFAFVLNAQQDYAQSALNASAVLGADAGWVFSHDARIAAADLHLLLAMDYYDQPPPDYAASLAEVQIVNAAFSADVTTVAGQSALGREIERLRGVI